MKKKNIIPFLFDNLLSENTRLRTEKIILNVVLVSLFIHLTVIYLLEFNVTHFKSTPELLTNPITAI